MWCWQNLVVGDPMDERRALLCQSKYQLVLLQGWPECVSVCCCLGSTGLICKRSWLPSKAQTKTHTSSISAFVLHMIISTQLIIAVNFAHVFIVQCMWIRAGVGGCCTILVLVVRYELVKISVTSQLFASQYNFHAVVCLTALVCNPFLTTGFDKVGKPQQLLLRLPQLYSPARSRSSARSTLEKSCHRTHDSMCHVIALSIPVLL